MANNIIEICIILIIALGILNLINIVYKKLTKKWF